MMWEVAIVGNVPPALQGLCFGNLSEQRAKELEKEMQVIYASRPYKAVARKSVA